MDTMKYYAEREAQRDELRDDYHTVTRQLAVYVAEHPKPESVFGLARYEDANPRYVFLEDVQINLQIKWEQEFGGDIMEGFE
jgi:hypothetical protein